MEGDDHRDRPPCNFLHPAWCIYLPTRKRTEHPLLMFADQKKSLTFHRDLARDFIPSGILWGIYSPHEERPYPFSSHLTQICKLVGCSFFVAVLNERNCKDEGTVPYWKRGKQSQLSRANRHSPHQSFAGRLQMLSLMTTF